MRHCIAGGGNARLENVRNDKYWKAYNTVDFVWVRNTSRVATNLECLEYSEISLNTENSGNSRGILCNFGEKLDE